VYAEKDLKFSKMKGEFDKRHATQYAKETRFADYKPRLTLKELFTTEEKQKILEQKELKEESQKQDVIIEDLLKEAIEWQKEVERTG